MAENQDNKRDSFRVPDKIAILINQLSNKARQQASEIFDSRRTAALASSESYHKMKREVTGLGYVKRRYPEVWDYIEFLEKKVDHCTTLQLGHDKALDSPTQSVDLSIGGLQFSSPMCLPENSMLELKIRVFPSLNLIYAFGCVARQVQINTAEGPAIRMAVEFTHMNPQDKDLLAKHIQQRQLDNIRAGKEDT